MSVLPEISRILNILRRMELLTISGNYGRPTLQNDVLPIDTSGPSDAVSFSDYAGTVPIAVVGKRASDDTFENIVTAMGNGYTLSAADDMDYILFEKEGINLPELAQSYKLQQRLAGNGTSIAFTSGYYSKVYFFYLSNATATPQVGPLQFTTQAGLDTYYSSAIMGAGKYVVFYGQAILDIDQYILGTGSIQLVLDNVDDNLPLILLPVAECNTLTATAGQTVLPWFGSSVAFIIYQQQVFFNQYSLTSEGIKLTFPLEAGKEVYIIERDSIAIIPTVANQDTYHYSGLMGIVPGLVIYGQQILQPNEYLIEGDEILISPGGPIDAAKKIFVVPKKQL